MIRYSTLGNVLHCRPVTNGQIVNDYQIQENIRNLKCMIGEWQTKTPRFMMFTWKCSAPTLNLFTHSAMLRFTYVLRLMI